MPEVKSLVLNVKSDSVATATGHLRTLDRTGAKTEQTVTKLSKVKFAALAAGLAGVATVTTALGVAANQATREWLVYDKAIKEVNSITNQTAKEFKTMRRDVLNLSVALGVDATQAAKGLYQVLSAGVPRENSIKFLETASKLAIAGVTDVNVAVDALTNTINAFKIPMEQADMVADKLFATVVNGKTTLEELSKNMSKASVPAAALGVDLDDLLGVVIGLTKQGTPVSESFTQVKAIMSALQNPSKELLQVYKDMGVESARTAIQQYGFSGSLEEIRQRLKGNDLALFNASRGMDGYNGILSVTGDNLKTVEDGIDAVKNSQGEHTRASVENSKSLDNSLNSLKASAVALVETMENSFGIIQSFTELLKDAAIQINEFNGTTLSVETQTILDNPQKTIQNLEDIDRRLTTLREKADSQRTRLQSYKDNPLLNVTANGGIVNSVLDFSQKSGDFTRTVNEIKALKEAYSGVNEELRWQYEAKKRIEEVRANEEKGLTVVGEHIRLGEIEREQVIAKLIARREQIELDATAAIEKEKRDKDAKKRAEELAEIAADEKKSAEEKAAAAKKFAQEEERRSKKAIDDAKDLATTEKERLQLRLDSISKERFYGKISDEVYQEAKANLEEQIRLLDERNNRVVPGAKSATSSFGGASSGFGMMPSAISSLPQISNPFGSRNEFDYLREQENEIIASYERRKEAIINLTDITETEKRELIRQSDQQLKDMMIQADVERNQIALGLAADFFGNISAMANAFGEKGAKVAKAAAITETIINTYKSATAAYASLAAIPYVGPALGAAAAGAAIAAGFANVQAIRAQPVNVGRYDRGGIVPGQSTSGDNVQARVNSGEMILNKSQQTKLFNIANGENSNGGTTVNVVVRPTPGQTADVKQNSSDPNQLEIVLRKVDEKFRSDLQTGGGKFVPALSKRISDLQKPV